jgi:hypothetical protein
MRDQERFDMAADEKRGGGTSVCHYIYYPTRKAAASAAVLIRLKGYSAEVGNEGHEGRWLLLVTQRTVPAMETIDQAMEELERFAQETCGAYDGHEVDLSGSRGTTPH